MRRRKLAWLLLLTGAAAAQTRNQAASLSLELDDATSTDVAAAWFVYGTAATVAYFDLRERVGREDLSPDDYTVEVIGRTALADYWRDAPDRGPDTYLDKLVAVQAAGFMEEYVIAVFAKPGWTIPPEALPKIDLDAFVEWARANLGLFESPTLAHVASPTIPPAPPAVPGANLPDPAPYYPSTTPCSRSATALREAMAAWKTESDDLRGAPLAAADQRGFGAALQAVRNEEPYRARGITWVAPNAGLLSYLAGYCAVDVGDVDAAAIWLTQGVTMLPLLPAVRLELAHALLAQRKLDEADAQVDRVLAIATERCDFARGWRRRGYIRFEQERWEESRAAYRKSLEYEPDSKLALDELRLIDQRLGKGGSNLPLPEVTQLTTHCAD